MYKVNLVRSLAHRIIRICSPTTVEGELTALRDILAKNGYPGELLYRFVTTDQPTRREGPRPCPLTLRVPWLGSKTEKLVRRANDAVRLAYPAGEVRAVYRTNKAFNLPKDRIPTQSQSNLIYPFECRQCGSRYVGKTAQRFADRISQHVPKHILDAVLDPQRKRPGRPPKKRDNPAEGYQSAVACHLAANADCCRSYRESEFTTMIHSGTLCIQRKVTKFPCFGGLVFRAQFQHFLSAFWRSFFALLLALVSMITITPTLSLSVFSLQRTRLFRTCGELWRTRWELWLYFEMQRRLDLWSFSWSWRRSREAQKWA